MLDRKRGDAERDTHGEIHREQSAVRIDILDGKPLKRGRGRWTTCCAAMCRAARAQATLDAGFCRSQERAGATHQGLEQVKAYARRHAVKFVYSTNATCSSNTTPIPA